MATKTSRRTTSKDSIGTIWNVMPTAITPTRKSRKAKIATDILKVFRLAHSLAEFSRVLNQPTHSSCFVSSFSVVIPVKAAELDPEGKVSRFFSTGLKRAPNPSSSWISAESTCEAMPPTTGAGKHSGSTDRLIAL
eukprot:1405091-Rhodomonas_salina.1